MGETGWSFESLLPKRQRWRIYGSGRRFRSLGSSPSRSSVTGRRASRIAGRRDGANGPNLRESGPPSGRRTRPSGGGGECYFGRRPQLRGRVNGARGVLSCPRSDGAIVLFGAPGSSRSADRGQRARSRRGRSRLPPAFMVAKRPRTARARPSVSSCAKMSDDGHRTRDVVSPAGDPLAVQLHTGTCRCRGGIDSPGSPV